MANMKHCILKALGWLYNSRKDVLCIQACIYIDKDHVNDKYIEKDYKLKRGYTPEQFGRYLEDINFEIDAIDLVGIIIWYTDHSYSWASDEEDDIKWEHHNRPDPDTFNL
jgi:hypothetical protein